MTFMEKHSFISKSGLAAGIVCIVLPLAVTGLLLFRSLTNKNSIDELIIWVVVTVFTVIPVQLAMNRELGRYMRRHMAGDEAPPTHALKLLYGAAHGLFISLAGLMLALLWVYFAT